MHDCKQKPFLQCIIFQLVLHCVLLCRERKRTNIFGMCMLHRILCCDRKRTNISYVHERFLLLLGGEQRMVRYVMLLTMLLLPSLACRSTHSTHCRARHLIRSGTNQKTWNSPAAMVNDITSRKYNSSPMGSALGVEVRADEVRFVVCLS